MRESRKVTDALGQKTGEVTHGYDAAGNERVLTVVGFDGSFGKTLAYTLPYFGGNGGVSDRSVKVTMGGVTLGSVTSYYAGMRSSVGYGSGLATSYPSYDVYMRPLAIDHPGSGHDRAYDLL